MSSAKPEVLKVPVRPAVMKYLRKQLHLAVGEAFTLTKKGTVGRLLYHLLRNPQQDRQYAISEQAYTGTFVVHVSQHLSWLNGCRHLTDQGTHDFNRQVEELIEQEFRVKLDTLAEFGVAFETKAQALRFMDGYGFTEDDITLEALIKSYYRYRKAQKTAQQRLVIIPNCPPVALAA